MTSSGIGSTTSSNFVLGFVAGGSIVGILSYIYIKNVTAVPSPTSTTTNTIDTIADDECNSLFYSKLNDVQKISGCGFSSIQYDVTDRNRMCVVHPEYSRLEYNLYKSVVENLVIVCVDIVCIRQCDKKLLLFYRRDPPASHIWWLPGGRLCKGETFTQAAIRKIVTETGYECNSIDKKIVSVGIINVWNTFFPDSAWDHDRVHDREGTQTVNIAMFCTIDINTDNNDKDFNQNNMDMYAVEKHRWVSKEEALVDGMYDKYVRVNVQGAIDKGYFN